MSDPGAGVKLPTTLWTVEMPRARLTHWHQTYQELIASVGQTIGLAMAAGHAKGAEVHVEVFIDGSRGVRIMVRSGDEEFVAIDARQETVN